MKSTSDLLTCHYVNRLWENTSDLVPMRCRCTRSSCEPSLDRAVGDRVKTSLKYKSSLAKINMKIKSFKWRKIRSKVTSRRRERRTSRQVHALWCTWKQWTSTGYQSRKNLLPMETNSGVKWDWKSFTPPWKIKFPDIMESWGTVLTSVCIPSFEWNLSCETSEKPLIISDQMHQPRAVKSIDMIHQYRLWWE